MKLAALRNPGIGMFLPKLSISRGKQSLTCLSLFLLITSFTNSLPADSPDASNQARREIQEGVPQGKLTRGVFEASKVFPGTRRDYAVYVPAQYQSDQPANLMVFMDGLNYAKPNGAYRVPTVLDNMIADGTLQPTIAVFVNPGTIVATKPDAKNRSNRSFEYDSLGDRYATFLIDEFLPVALGDLNVATDPKQRAVAGSSSGGICAFTVAWERPDQFGKVLSHIGSYTNIRGGWEYPGLIRKTKSNPKPLRVYLQDGRDDLSNLHGSWPLGNRDMAAALQFAGYPYKFVMTDGGHSGKWAGEELPAALEWLWDENAESTHIPHVSTKPKWEPHPLAVAREDVPHGTVTEMPIWESKVFPNTIRKWAIYVPAQYDPSTPAALMVFQDGERMRDTKGRWRIPTVLDNLIASGDMPPTIAVFLDPGHDKDKPRRGKKSSNRGFEYDSLGDRYSRFLLEEILPEVEKQYNLSDDPKMRAIGGSSSGAICAFTVAWERPDQFGKVYSSVGSFVNLRGGDAYPGLIRKTEPKPIRITMSDTSGDNDNPFGHWPIANLRMADALQYMGYDARLDWAEGYGHNADYGSYQFPAAMKWLWRNESHTPQIDTSDDLRGDLTLLNLLIPDKDWEVVAKDLGFSDAPCSDNEGNFYYCDMRAPAIVRVDARDQSKTTIAKESVSGLMFGPDGLMYACQGSQKRVISIDPNNGEVKIIAEDVAPNDLAVTDDGYLFITETRTHHVTRINIATGEKTIADEGLVRPNGIALSNDGGTLAVSDHGGEVTWTFRVNPGGILDAKMPTMPMRLPIDPKGEFNFNQPPPYLTASKGDGMAVDKKGRYYVTSAVGVQIFDPTGRPCGVLPTPDPTKPLTSCFLAGPEHSHLYVTNGPTIFRRQLSVEK
ncbi:alpha/beta hydrolase-fold protein [Rhodopirellula halodulae]|uniref:alpha/beta hydrolase-fold protein n=1 Tax=Rhodopirellula halodulae TaxID=2894198 RepID=UPI001E3B2EBC|nr:alpha/beta hydrolase-fold protein [Rhodopirellula sp. JC737]MCC9655996.1 SMP-30/gluconolactonase/LRE family protein [Rhodopirellula sp. JC737]